MILRSALISSVMLSLLTAVIAGSLYYITLNELSTREFNQAAQQSVSRLGNIVAQQIELGRKPVQALASSPEAHDFLKTPDNPQRQAVNTALDRYCHVFQASDCYLMDVDGMTRASSNRDRPGMLICV